MYSIYYTWVKCKVELHSFKDFDLKSFVKQQVIFYANVFNYVFEDNHRRKLLQKHKESICKLYLFLWICTYVFFVAVCSGCYCTFEGPVNDYHYYKDYLAFRHIYTEYVSNKISKHLYKR